jgi:glycosyltransferase involved in cell wall biosynthesis
MARLLFVCRLPKIDLDCPASDLALGGIETCNLELARELAQRGHRVALAGTPQGPAAADSFGVTHLGLDMAGTQDFDAIVVSSIATDFDRFSGSGATPIYWLHNPLRLEKAFRKGYLGPFLRHRPHAIFPSADLASRTARYPFASRDVIGHGLDAVFLAAPAARHDSNGPPRFVFASQPHRGLDRVLRLWRDAIAPALPGAELHLLGGAASSFAAQAPRIQVHGRVTKRKMAEIYVDARAMLCPGTEDETYCLAAAEAQCVGLPLVTLGMGALKERVSHGVNGFLCRDDADFAEKAILLGKRADLAAHLGAGALTQRVNRSWSFIAGLWETLIFTRQDRGAPQPIAESA